MTSLAPLLRWCCRFRGETGTCVIPMLPSCTSPFSGGTVTLPLSLVTVFAATDPIPVPESRSIYPTARSGYPGSTGIFPAGTARYEVTVDTLPSSVGTASTTLTSGSP